MTNLRRRDDWSARSGSLKRFPDLPRATQILRLTLQVPARHVETNCIAENVIQSAFDRNVSATRFQRHEHLQLVMNIVGFGGIGKLAAFVEIVGVLLEEKRRLTVGVTAHLDRMRRIISSDAIDTPHGGRRG